ncbi:DUF5701 family protein [Saccharopolyspora sp. ASAGF58]|uniref:DUF5701 family protein n=1 Tax=Saccharopolyspora sp. ASAGF58 TaxID=2719023 RepID=UPI00143FF504|nr:DUF5701 family protein [Saccharopolyspora sp. ASAGF58]QIZ36462.1 hypothetical protein FDZ84_19550 [Saccharopolyspora sp. ASAGF58]
MAGLAPQFDAVVAPLRDRAAAVGKCFSVGGSRCGDRRVAAIWISQNAPKLGWCWEDNPHTWPGTASPAARRAAG